MNQSKSNTSQITKRVAKFEQTKAELNEAHEAAEAIANETWEALHDEQQSFDAVAELISAGKDKPSSIDKYRRAVDVAQGRYNKALRAAEEAKAVCVEHDQGEPALRRELLESQRRDFVAEYHAAISSVSKKAAGLYDALAALRELESSPIVAAVGMDGRADFSYAMQNRAHAKFGTLWREGVLSLCAPICEYSQYALLGAGGWFQRNSSAEAVLADFEAREASRIAEIFPDIAKELEARYAA